jgi:hypothetical protein
MQINEILFSLAKLIRTTMTYKELLEDSRWQTKRREILDLSGNCCSKCSNTKILENCLRGLLLYSKNSSKGYVYNCYLIDASKNIYRKPLILSDEVHEKCLTDKSHFVYLDPASKDEKFARFVAIRRRNLRLKLIHPLMLFDPEAVSSTLFLDELTGDFNWVYSKALHVHHKYYQTYKKPWEYPNDALQTLCWLCHEELHKNTKIPSLDKNGNETTSLTPCTKCFGAGWFPQYKHIEEGVCFHCNGAKYLELIQKLPF